MREKRAWNLSVVNGRLYSPHQIRLSVPCSRTTNLSAAARAVCLPVSTIRGPSAAICPSERWIASSYRAAAGRFQ